MRWVRVVVAVLLAGGLGLAASCARKPAADTRPHPQLDPASRSVAVAAVVAKQDVYAELKGAVEYVLVGKGGKEYETLFTTEVPADELYQALLKLGLSPGVPANEGEVPRGQPMRIWVEYTTTAGKPLRRPVEEFMFIDDSGTPMPVVPWPFTGSAIGADPSSGKAMLQAALTLSLVGLRYEDASTLFQPPLLGGAEKVIYRSNPAVLPPEGTPVKVVFQRTPPRPWARRVHVVMAGRVQGVGLEAFTERQARLLKLTGFVRTRADGKVEAVAEGPAEAIGQLLEQMRRGPRPARIEQFDAADEPVEGDFDRFEVWN